MAPVDQPGYKLTYSLEGLNINAGPKEVDEKQRLKLQMVRVLATPTQAPSVCCNLPLLILLFFPPGFGLALDTCPAIPRFLICYCLLCGLSPQVAFDPFPAACPLPCHVAVPLALVKADQC